MCLQDEKELKSIWNVGTRRRDRFMHEDNGNEMWETRGVACFRMLFKYWLGAVGNISHENQTTYT